MFVASGCVASPVAASRFAELALRCCVCRLSRTQAASASVAAARKNGAEQRLDYPRQAGFHRGAKFPAADARELVAIQGVSRSSYREVRRRPPLEGPPAYRLPTAALPPFASPPLPLPSHLWLRDSRTPASRLSPTTTSCGV
eukprot:130445-Chlamydomonas_euryale.AAC.1